MGSKECFVEGAAGFRGCGRQEGAAATAGGERGGLGSGISWLALTGPGGDRIVMGMDRG